MTISQSFHFSSDQVVGCCWTFHRNFSSSRQFPSSVVSVCEIISHLEIKLRIWSHSLIEIIFSSRNHSPSTFYIVSSFLVLLPLGSILYPPEHELKIRSVSFQNESSSHIIQDLKIYLLVRLNVTLKTSYHWSGCKILRKNFTTQFKVNMF